MTPSDKKGSTFLNSKIMAHIRPVALRLSFLTAVAATGVYYLHPKRTVNPKITQLSADNQEIFNKFSESMKISDYQIENQSGVYQEVKQFLLESTDGKQAKIYAENIVEQMHRDVKDNTYETLESKIELAKGVILDARRFIQRKEQGGNATYTRGYEYSEKREGLKKDILAWDILEEEKSRLIATINDEEFESTNSYQKFDEFYSPKDGRILAGDCDDFSIALTTTYHAVKDYVNLKKGSKEFYTALAEGLNHYKIFSVEIDSHALNISATLTDKVEFEAIEPQNISSKVFIDFVDGKANINDATSSKDIARIYNREFSAVKKEKWDK